MTYFQDAKTSLEQVASTYAETIIHSIQQEYPNQMQHMMMGPEDRPTPREAHRAFYGCFDWHSSVEMHWAAFVWKHLNAILPADDKRRPHLKVGIETHARASMGAVTGSDYMVEHWLACYAMLYLSGG